MPLLLVPVPARSIPALPVVIVPPVLVPADGRPIRSLGFPVFIRSLVIVPLSMRVLVVRSVPSMSLSVVRFSQPITPTASNAAADKTRMFLILIPRN